MRTRRRQVSTASLSDTEEITISVPSSSTDSAPEEVDIRRTGQTPQRLSPNPGSTQLLCYAALSVVLIGAALALLTVVLNIGIVAVGALIPAWQTFRALESRSPSTSDDDDDDTEYLPPGLYLRNWAAYWVVVSGLYSLESMFVRPTIGSVIPSPLYPAMIFAGLVYLTNNNAEKAGAMYMDVARPTLLRMEDSVDRSSKAVVKHLEDFFRLALVRFHDVVEPYTMQLRHAAAMSAQQLQAQRQEPVNDNRRRRLWRF